MMQHSLSLTLYAFPLSDCMFKKKWNDIKFGQIPICHKQALLLLDQISYHMVKNSLQLLSRKAYSVVDSGICNSNSHIVNLTLDSKCIPLTHRVCWSHFVVVVRLYKCLLPCMVVNMSQPVNMVLLHNWINIPTCQNVTSRKQCYPLAERVEWNPEGTKSFWGWKPGDDFVPKVLTAIQGSMYYRTT